MIVAVRTTGCLYCVCKQNLKLNLILMDMRPTFGRARPNRMTNDCNMVWAYTLEKVTL